jgi:hypothetical protein
MMLLHSLLAGVVLAALSGAEIIYAGVNSGEYTEKRGRRPMLIGLKRAENLPSKTYRGRLVSTTSSSTRVRLISSLAPVSTLFAFLSSWYVLLILVC